MPFFLSFFLFEYDISVMMFKVYDFEERECVC